MALDNDSGRDRLMRNAAFEKVRKLCEVDNSLTAEDLKPGFTYQGKRIPLVNPQRGIFKPQSMRHLLSIRTVFPRPGGKVWYADQLDVNRRIFEGDETADYSFMGKDPNAADNRWLREAFAKQIPVIYFLGVAPGRYQAFFPAFIAGWESKALSAKVAFGALNLDEHAPPETASERRYALSTVKQRLHQATFREAVITAYHGRCAVSGLPERRLIDAAHIISDKNERLGQPVVPNGLPLSKLHHAAFDAHLIGIDPSYQMHVSVQLLNLDDGPMLETLKHLDGRKINLPAHLEDYPDPERLAARFAQFQEHV